jgi:hypothetical protein
VRGHLTQQVAERFLLRGTQAGKQVLFGAAEALVQLGQDLPAVRGRGHPAGTPVHRVRLALHEAGAFEVVKQVGHDGAVDAEPARQRRLTARLVAGGRAQHLIAAVAAGHALGRRVGRLHVCAE